MTAPKWWTRVNGYDGSIAAIAIEHPDSGLVDALNGTYKGHGGLNQWCADHPAEIEETQ